MPAPGGHSDASQITPRRRVLELLFCVTHPGLRSLSVHIYSYHGYPARLQLLAIVNVIAMAIMVPSLFRAGAAYHPLFTCR